MNSSDEHRRGQPNGNSPRWKTGESARGDPGGQRDRDRNHACHAKRRRMSAKERETDRFRRQREKQLTIEILLKTRQGRGKHSAGGEVSISPLMGMYPRKWKQEEQRKHLAEAGDRRFWANTPFRSEANISSETPVGGEKDFSSEKGLQSGA